MSTPTQRDLFGGAITALLPVNLIDASDLRQIPDTQEVFLHPESSVSIIVEILQRVEANENADAAKFHFDSLAHDNEAQSSTVHDVITIPNDRQGDATPSLIILTGTQYVKKFNRQHPDEVRIAMCIYRVHAKNIDLVVTTNVPMISDDGGAVGEQGWISAKADFDTMVKSLRIVNFGLFV